MCESKTFIALREERKGKKLMANGLMIYWILCLIMISGFILLKSCQKETTPAMAAEVSLPAITKDDEPTATWTEEEKCNDFLIGCNEIDVHNEIVKQAREYHMDEKIALTIAECESTFDIYAKNTKSTAKGVYQFTDPTWKWIKASGNQYDYKENIRQFMIWYQVHPEWWDECNTKINLK